MRDGRTPLGDLSKRAFNSEHRLTIANALAATNGLISNNELADSVGVNRASCHNELNLLAELGVVQRVAATRSVLYQPVPGPFWTWVDQLVGLAARPRRDTAIAEDPQP